MCVCSALSPQKQLQDIKQLHKSINIKHDETENKIKKKILKIIALSIYVLDPHFVCRFSFSLSV